MSYIVVDVESDSISPSSGSMVCFGAVLVSDLNVSFYGQVRPINNSYNKDALAISGFTREQHELFDDPSEVMSKFAIWVNSVCETRPMFISDNPAFDWQWINFYFDKYLGKNPFGYSARRIGDLYCGMVKNAGKNAVWKRKYRKTKHDHHPVNDAKGNAEAIIAMKEEGLKITL